MTTNLISMPKLRRDDPSRAPLSGNIKVTRNDWIRQAMATLIRDGVDAIKIKTLANAMQVSRSSFYWYFEDRDDLLCQLVAAWIDKNTGAIEGQARMPASTITEAVCHIFACVIDRELFDTKLDFAMRDWARRDANVQKILAASDARRLDALTEMFMRHGYDPMEAATRGEVLYYMEIGFDVAAPTMAPEVRLSMISHYLKVFTGQEPRGPEVAAFAIFARMHWAKAGLKKRA